MVCGEVELSPIGNQVEVPYRHGFVGDEPPNKLHDPKTDMVCFKQGLFALLAPSSVAPCPRSTFFPFMMR